MPPVAETPVERPALLPPAGWVSLALGAVVVAALLGFGIARRSDVGRGASIEPPPAVAPTQAASVSGATVYRQADPMAIAAQNNPALAAQMARNSALAAAQPALALGAPRPAAKVQRGAPVARIVVEPAQGGGTVSQVRGPAGGGEVVGRSAQAGPPLATGPAQGTAIAPPATPLPDAPKG